MKNKVLLAIIIVLIAGVGWVSGRQVTADRVAWEYRASYSSSIQTEDFNRLGAEGWELVAVACPGNSQCVYQFKRAK